MTTRILVVDDQALIRAGFRAILDSEADLEVVGEAADGHEAVAAVRALAPDVVLMDIRMPGLDGIAATEEILSDAELSGVRILVLTTFDADDNVLAALRAGASGFLGKDVGPTGLVEGVRAVASGESLLSPRAARSLIDRYLAMPVEAASATPAALATLTQREREVVVLVGRGLTNDQIAGELYVSPHTAKTHVNRAMGKLGVRDRAQLVVVAWQTGLVRIGGS